LNADPELGDGVTRRLLRDAILRALELCPHHAAYWYRLAILNCMDETLDEACDALRRGIAFDREFRWRDRYDLRADAVNRLPALNRYSRKAEVGYAGVYAARAIARCDGFRTELFDEFKKSDLETPH